MRSCIFTDLTLSPQRLGRLARSACQDGIYCCLIPVAESVRQWALFKVVGDIRRCLNLQTFPPTDRLAACSLITYRDSIYAPYVHLSMFLWQHRGLTLSSRCHLKTIMTLSIAHTSTNADDLAKLLVSPSIQYNTIQYKFGLVERGLQIVQGR